MAAIVCNNCDVSIPYEGDAPAWLTYDYEKEQPEAYARSVAFVASNPAPHKAYDPDPSKRGRPWLAYRDAGYPPYIGEGPEGQVVLAVPEPYRYLICPECNWHVKEIV